MTSGAETGIQNKPFIAAVNRCATQKQRQIRFFLKPSSRGADSRIFLQQPKACERTSNTVRRIKLLVSDRGTHCK
jgi:hypothetical protein